MTNEEKSYSVIADDECLYDVYSNSECIDSAMEMEKVEKKDTLSKLTEEEIVTVQSGLLKNVALSFINYLDDHRYNGKMCLSNGECKDIENAFLNSEWDKLHRYYCKFIADQEDIEPIPLTKEILKANGFNENVGSFGIEYLWTTGGINKYYDVYIYVGKDQNDELRWDSIHIRIKFYNGDLSLFRKKYVHELRQALRMCGLDEMANNFKIE